MSGAVTSSRVFNSEQIRQEFPVFSASGKDEQTNSSDSLCVHLNNAATTHKPFSVIHAVSQFYKKNNANVHRASQLLSAKTTENFESARCVVQQFVNAQYTEEIIWTKGATESINLVAQSWGRTQLHAGDEILLMSSEHHANIVPWQQVAKEVGAIIRVVPVMHNAALNMQAFYRLLNHKTRIVGVGHVSNATGRINPVEEIITAAHRVGALVLVDGAQAASHMKLDVQALDCDFYVISGHKMYGPNGIGVLYGKRKHLEVMPPWQTGGGMVSRVSFEEGTHFNPLPFKLEAGTPNIAAVLGLAEAIHYLNAFDRTAISQHETALLERLYDGLSTLPGIRIIGERSERAGVISFVSEDYHHHDLSLLLSDKGIILRSGHHCTMPLMEALDLKGTLRVSVAMYSNNEDVDRFLCALKDVLNGKEDKTSHLSDLKPVNHDKPNNDKASCPHIPKVLATLLKKQDWSSRYRDIMRLGKTLPPLPATLRCDENLVPGCESAVWLAMEYDADSQQIKYYADSDSSIMRGLITLLLLFIDHKSPQEVMETPLASWFDQLGLMQHLSITRGNGLRTMMNIVYNTARQYLIEEDALS